MMKEDCHAFGVIAAKAVSPEEAFAYPITSVPLAIANLDNTLRQTEKSCFRNMLILEFRMAAVRTIKPKKVYKDWLQKLITFVEPPKDSCPSLVGFINDTYREISIKNGIRILREAGRNKHIDGFEQHMPQGLKWVEFLSNNFNKEELINLISQYLQSDDIRKSFTHPFIVTCGEGAYNIPAQGQITTSICNHEEADTRLVKHALAAQ